MRECGFHPNTRDESFFYHPGALLAECKTSLRNPVYSNFTHGKMQFDT